MAADDSEIEMRLADPAYVAALPSAALEVLGALLERLRPEVVARVASTQGLLAKMSQEQVFLTVPKTLTFFTPFKEINSQVLRYHHP